MATKKAVKKQKQIKGKGKIQLPNGYKVIGRAPVWDVEKNPILEGVRGEELSRTMDKGTKKEREQRFFVVQSEELGAVTVWESSMLKDLFDQTEEGSEIRIEFLGYGEAKKGQNPPKLFACGVKE